MLTRKQKVRLGLFLVIGVGAVVVGLALVAGLSLFKRYDHYEIRFTETVSGLSVGSPVKLRGVEVGRVEDMDIDPDDTDVVRVRIRLRHGTPIVQGAWAALNSSGITGLKYIDIQGGKKGAPRLEPGSQIPAHTSTLSQITGKAETIAFKLEKLLNNILAFTGPQRRDAFNDLVDQARSALHNTSRFADQGTKTLERVGPRLDRALYDFARSARQIRRTASRVDHLVAATDKEFVGALKDMRRVLAHLDDMTKKKGDMGRTLAQVRHFLRVLQRKLAGKQMDANLSQLHKALTAMRLLALDLRGLVTRASVDLRPAVRAIRRAAENLEGFARAIRENPAAILRPSSTRRR